MPLLRPRATPPPTKAPHGRPPVCCIAWTHQTERADELAAALGGVARRMDGAGLRGPATAPVRYLVNTISTLRYLRFERPRAVLVQNPPIFAGLAAYAWCRWAAIPLVLDSHPASFGRKGRRIWRLLLPLNRFLARRASLVLVTVDELADEVAGWGGAAAVVHEAPPTLPDAPQATRPLRPRPRVLFVGVFASDEPVDAVLGAARLAPGLDVDVTGDTTRAPGELLASAPPNVRFVGFLDRRGYATALAEADIVLVLTTEPTSVVRAGCEAVYARRPLVLSDTPALRQTFSQAVFVDNAPVAIADGLMRAAAEHADLVERSARALAEQQERWASQLSAVQAAIAATPRPAARQPA